MILITCFTILIYVVLGKDIKPLLAKLKGIDWNHYSSKAWNKIQKYSKIAGRAACEPLLKLWFVLDDPDTQAWEKAMIYAAIIYTVSPLSLISVSRYRLLGYVDEGCAILYIRSIVMKKMTPEIEKKVKDVLDSWFGPDYSASPSNA